MNKIDGDKFIDALSDMICAADELAPLKKELAAVKAELNDAKGWISRQDAHIEEAHEVIEQLYDFAQDCLNAMGEEGMVAGPHEDDLPDVSFYLPDHGPDYEDEP